MNRLARQFLNLGIIVWHSQCSRLERKRLPSSLPSFLLRILIDPRHCFCYTLCGQRSSHYPKRNPITIGIQDPKYSCMSPQVKFHVEQMVFLHCSVTRWEFFAMNFAEQCRVNNFAFYFVVACGAWALIKVTFLRPVVACETISPNNEIFGLANMGYQLAKHWRGRMHSNAIISRSWQIVHEDTNC